MPTKFWIKLYIEMLDDPKMARLPNYLWRRAVEFFLLAGRQGEEGALPPVEEMAWSLRLSEDKLLEDLQRLAGVGVVHICNTDAAGTSENRPGRWCVTHFKETQNCESVERVRRYRERTRNAQRNGAATEDGSTSASDSVREGVTGEGEALVVPSSPVEAMLHPDVRVFSAVTGGRIPGLSQYRAVIEAVRYLRKVKGLDDQALAAWLKPYWLAWSGRKRLDGRPYDPSNLTWLTEWALNGSVPPQGGPKEVEAARPRVASPAETRRRLDEREASLKTAVPPPEHIREKMRGLKERLKGEKIT